MIQPKDHACPTCGAGIGERCRPLYYHIGVHLARLLAAGGAPRPR